MKFFKRKKEQENPEVQTIEEVMREVEYEYDSPSAHLLDVLENLHDAVRWRYEAGQKEHGGRLWRKECLSRLLDELTDAMIYAVTLEHQLEAIQDIIYEVRGGKLDPMKALNAISAIVWCGNPYGEHEEDKQFAYQEEGEDDE